MSDQGEFEFAYERERKIRLKAEQLLEDKSRELYLQNCRLEDSYKQLKKQQAMMLTQEKLATLGTLSAGIAHEINNPLGFIKSNVDSLNQYMGAYAALFSMVNEELSAMPEATQTKLNTLLKDLDLAYVGEDYPELLEDTLAGIKRVQDIALNLKSFSKTEDSTNGKVDIVEGIKNTVTLMGAELENALALKLDLTPVEYFNGDPSEMNQVLVNLIINAKQATENVKSPKLRIRTWQDEDYVYVSILDNGCGMDSETAKHIFTPFFTTRPVGSGTGMGLSIAYGIVQKHGGKIKVRSKVEKGSDFILQLPREV